MTFWSRESSHYAIQSAALSYQASMSSPGLCARLTGLLPRKVSQDDRAFSTSEVYRSAYGADLFLGWQWRWAVGPRLEADLAPGLHAAFVKLAGRTGYTDFHAAPLGLGSTLSLSWASSRLRAGAIASGSVDFADPMHRNDLKRGFVIQTGIVVALAEE